MRMIVLWFSLLMLTLSLYAELPESLPIAVTYYDFHSDGSCPDFNPVDDRDTVTPFMVADKLVDGYLKKGARSYFSSCIEKWFQSYDDHIDKNIIPDYIYDDFDQESHGSLETMKSVSTDTTYINKQIFDSLQLDLVDKENGVYSFSSSTFFPIDGKGFDKEWTVKWDNSGYAYDHNYSFSMRMDREFTYRSGREWFFTVEGDDDIWLFINGVKVIDLGGIHATSKDSINLDDIAAAIGLVDTGVYTLSLFFAERQATGSNLNIRWNFPLTNSSPKVEVHLEDQQLLEDAADTIIADCDTLFTDSDAMQYALYSTDSSLFIPFLDGENRCYIQTVQEAHGSGELVLTATDSEGLTVSDTVTIILASVNDTPIVTSPLQDLILPEDFPDTNIGSVVPLFIDDDLLTYTVSSLDSAVIMPLILENSLILKAVDNAYGVSQVLLTATDTGQLSVTDTFVVQVSSLNDAPYLLNKMEDVVIHEDAEDTLLHFLTSHFSDDDLLSYSLTLSDSSVVSLDVSLEERISLATIKDQFGEVTAVVTATDSSGLFVRDTFSITVESVNDIPVITTPLGNIRLPENCKDTLIADLHSLFSDDDTLAFTLHSSDSLLVVPFKTINDSLGLYIHSDVFGACTLSICAVDSGGLSAADTLVVTIVEGNNAPVLIKPIEECSITEDTTTIEWADLENHFSDDGVLLYQIYSTDSTVIVPALKEESILTITPVPNAFGTASVIVKASDDAGLWAADTFSVTVSSVNDAPLLVKALADITLNEDSPLFTGDKLGEYFSDDGLLSYRVSVATDLFSVQINQEEKLEITCTPDAFGTAPLIVTAVDSDELTVSDTLLVTLLPVNDAPLLIGHLQDLTIPATPGVLTIATVDTLFSDDGYLTFSVSSDDSAVGIGFIKDRVLSCDIKSFATATLSLIVSATDSAGLSVSDTMQIELEKQSDPPVVVAPVEDQRVLANSGSKDIVDFSTVFHSNEDLSYSVTVLPETIIAVTIREQNICVATPKPDALGECVVVVSAMDPLLRSVSDTFLVTVFKENSAPILLHKLPDVGVVTGQIDTILADLDTVFADEDSLRFSVSSSDSDLVLATVNLDNELTINVVSENTGVAELIVSSHDSEGLTTSDTIAVTVTAHNSVPVVVAPVQDIVVLKNSKDTTVAILAEVFFDDGPLKYRVSSGNEALVICNLDIDGRVTLSFLPESIGETDIILTATDSEGAVASDIFRVKVNGSNEKPVLLTPFADISMIEDGPEVVIGDLTTFFSDEAALSFIVEVMDSSLLTAQLDAKRYLKLRGRPDSFGSTAVLVRATDVEGLFLEDTFSVTIASVNDTPQLLEPFEDIVLVEDDSTFTGEMLSTHFADDDTLLFHCTVLNSALVSAEISHEAQLLITPKPDAFGSTNLVCSATDISGATISDTLMVTVMRDDTDGDNIFDEDMGAVLNDRILGITAAPNPLPRGVSIMQVSIKHNGSERICGTLLSVIGDEVLTIDAVMQSHSRALLTLDLSPYHSMLAGQSFLLYVKHYRGGRIIKEETLPIGVRR